MNDQIDRRGFLSGAAALFAAVVLVQPEAVEEILAPEVVAPVLAGGYFIPPLWLVDEYIPFLRSGGTISA